MAIIRKRGIIRRGLRRKKETVVTTPLPSKQAPSVKVTDFPSTGESVKTVTTYTPAGGSVTERIVTGAGGSAVSQARQQQLIEATRKLEEQRKQAELKKQEEAKKQAELRRQQEIKKLQLVRENILERAVRERTQTEEKLKREIQDLEQRRRDVARQSITEEEFNKIIQAKKDKEQELRNLQTGITAYNKKVDKLVNDAQTSLDNYIKDQVAILQARVNNEEIDVTTANNILKNRIEKTSKTINEVLNSKIEKIPVPEAMKVPVSTVEAVEPPKGILEKGITKLKTIPTPTPKEDDKLLKETIMGLRELGIGISLGVLETAKGIRELPRTLFTLVTNPSIILRLPLGTIRDEFSVIGRNLKLSPTRTIAQIGTEIYLMQLGGKGKIIKTEKITNSKKIKNFLDKLRKTGKINKITFKIVRGKLPRIEVNFKDLEKAIKPITTSKNINSVVRDISKLIPNEIPKVKVSGINKLVNQTVEKFLRDKTVIAELLKKYPTKTRFTLREIRTIRSYAKLKSIIKAEVFSKFGVKTVRKVTKKATGKRIIAGVKVGKKEFKSFQEANKEFQKLKRLGQFIKRIREEGGAGKIESLSRKSLTAKEFDYLKTASRLPQNILRGVESISVNTFVQRFTVRIPVIKRFGTLKEGYWGIVFKDIRFYENSVAFSLYGKSERALGTITMKAISSKPITRFRSITNALKWGTNKEIIFSKLIGKDFVRSFVLSSRGRKISATEFLSKIKITNKGELQEIRIITKKIPKFRTKGIEEQFKRAIPISATRGVIKKVVQPLVTKWNKSKGILEIIQRGKTIKLIKTKSILNPVIIDTSKIDNVIRTLENLKKQTLDRARLNKIKQYKEFIQSVDKSKSFILNGKKEIAISKTNLKQIEKISNELRTLKESIAGRTIPPQIKIRKRIEGVKELKKLKAIDKELRQARRIKTLDKAGRIALTQSLILSNKLKKELQKGQILKSDQKVKQIQTTVQKSIQKTQNKTIVRTIRKLETVIPFLKLIPKTPRVKVPKVEKKKFRIKIKKKVEEVKFKKFSKPVKIFSVVVKRRGRNIILNNKLTERDALNFMALKLDNRLLRSSVLKPTGTSKIVRKLPREFDGAWDKLKEKFRQYKITQKKKVPIRGFIEKRKYALDTQGERKQLARVRKKSIKKKTIKKVAKKKAVKKRTPVKRITKKPIKKKTIKKKITRRKTTTKRIKR